MKRDQAAKIAEKEYPVDKWSSTEERGYAVSMRPTLEKRIRRAISAAVRKERERCVGCIMPDRERYFLDRTIRVAPHLVCEEIIEKINAKAIRKGKA